MSSRNITALLLVFIMGCGSVPTDYHIKTYADDFEGVTTFRLEGNTVTDAIHNDNYIRIEFDIQKTIFRDSSVSYSILIGYLSSDWLFVGKGESLIMLLDGERVGFSGDGSSEYRQVGSGGVVSELAFYPISREMLGRLAHARDVRIKLIGEKYSLERALEPTNIQNIEKFYSEY